MVYLGAFLTNDISGCPPPSLLHPKDLSLESLKAEVGWPSNGVLGLFSLEATLATLVYYFVTLLMLKVLPGVECQGPELKIGGKLWYKFNGMIATTMNILTGFVDFTQVLSLPC